MSLARLLSPRGVRKKYGVDRCAGPDVAVRPQVRVRVQCLRSTGMTEPRLHYFDALAVPYQQARVEVPQVVKPGAMWGAGICHRGPPYRPERGPPDRASVLVGEYARPKRPEWRVGN